MPIGAEWNNCPQRPSAAEPQLKEPGDKEDELGKEFRIRESRVHEIDPRILNTKATRKRPEVRKSRTIKFEPPAFGFLTPINANFDLSIRNGN
jgi:hypothetical protein